MMAIERNKIGKDRLSDRTPKYVRERGLYGKKEAPSYKRSVHNSQKRKEEDSSVLKLGVVGETVGKATGRKAAKGNSLDMRLPKIGDGMLRDKANYIKAQNSIDSLKLPNLQKYKHGKYFVSNQKGSYKKYPGNVMSLQSLL